MTHNVKLADELRRRMDSLQNGYMPPDELVIDPGLRLHTVSDVDLDPVTYEVLRSKLWNLNLDHGETIRRVSGSNIVVEALDLNCATTTELGDAVTLSPYTTLFAGLADADIKWTLEHRSGNVGIREGDVFLQNDPWVGANHQMDTAVFSPVFVDGELFSWVYNCAHQREIGGRYPGGFIQDAEDVYTEATFMPPIKLAENYVMRADVVDMWIRRSRLPEVTTLDLNSQMAGIRTATERLLALVDRYGADMVKATMYRMIDDTARIVGRRLSELPDADWSDERYISGVSPGNLAHQKLAMTFRKRGDRVSICNKGTAAAIGAVNVPPALFRASVLAGLLPTLAFDQYFCAAGVLRQLDFDLDPGTITSAPHPHAVSPSLGSIATVSQAQLLGSKMVSAHAELSNHAYSSSTLHTMSTNSVAGRDSFGNLVGLPILDMLAGGVGAFSHRDGIDFGGSPTAIAHPFSDVEKVEQDAAMLYLYRRVLPDLGGHGRWRGGATHAICVVGHKVEDFSVSSTGFAKSVTMGQGVCGGFPATGGRSWHATDTGIQEAFKNGTLPGGPDEARALAPHGAVVGPSVGNRLLPDDMFELIANPGAGWGDPLDREPSLVADDLDRGRVDDRTAREFYGVVITPAGVVDEDATQSARTGIRAQRLAQSSPPRQPRDNTVEGSAVVGAVIEGVAIANGSQGLVFACEGCGHELAETSSTYRLGCREIEMPTSELSPYFTSAVEETGQELLIRLHVCPGCARILDTTLCHLEDPPFQDVSLAQ